MTKQNNVEKRDKIHRKYSSTLRENVEFRPARKEKSIFDENEIMRVAFYCRVSTGNIEQLTSYISQQQQCEEYVSQHPSWVLVDIYADEGISGTSMKRRTEFLRMLKDCESGKIDIIIVKSVSRFARCTEDFIACLRNLANHKPPIGVFFQTEQIYTLDESKQLTLTLLAGFAQEESHSKSVNSEISIEHRYNRHNFLTPPLLGFDNDEDGNLVINEDEAETVRLIFAMYQNGKPCDFIAKTLMACKRKTKLGNTNWTPSTIHGVLHNERHCGDIIARKTWTPSYLDHKSVKNRVDENGEWDKPQYYEANHHEAIISRDDYIAVQKMMTNAKYGGRRFMPELRVNSGGALHGFVSINPRWGAFSTYDYMFASRTVGEMDKTEDLLSVKRGESDLRGYEVARAQFFNTAEKTSGTFYDRNARFSGECIRKLGSAEFVEILVHPTNKILAVRECSHENRNSIKWAKFIGDKAYTRQFGGAAYLGTIFDLFDWNFAWGYRLRGTVRYVGGDLVAFFDAKEVEVLIPRSSALMLSRLTDDYYLAAQSNYQFTAMPVRWKFDFGSSFYTQLARNTRIDRAGIGTEIEHNTNPDIHPTEEEILTIRINEILNKFKNKEELNGKSDNGVS